MAIKLVQSLSIKGNVVDSCCFHHGETVLALP